MRIVGVLGVALSGLFVIGAVTAKQLGKRGHVDHWQSALPPSLSEATHSPWHEMSNELLSLEHIQQRDK